MSKTQQMAQVTNRWPGSWIETLGEIQEERVREKERMKESSNVRWRALTTAAPLKLGKPIHIVTHIRSILYRLGQRGPAYQCANIIENRIATTTKIIFSKIIIITDTLMR